MSQGQGSAYIGPTKVVLEAMFPSRYDAHVQTYRAAKWLAARLARDTDAMARVDAYVSELIQRINQG